MLGKCKVGRFVPLPIARKMMYINSINPNHFKRRET